MKKNKVYILLIILAVYGLLLAAPALISHLISGLGPFFPILIFILIVNARNGRNRFRSWFDENEYDERQNTREDKSERIESNESTQSYYQNTLFHPFLGKTKYFRDCEDFESAKRKYYRLIKEAHPDNSRSDAEFCAELNSEFDSIQDYFHIK